MNPVATIIADRLDALAACTDGPGEITRVAYSPAMREAHVLVRAWMEEAGLEVRVDGIGNLIGRRTSIAPEARTLLLGSHLDSVRSAGRFDGPLGVVTGIAVADALKDTKLPFHLEVVGFIDEEGVRFQSTYLGSKALAGTLTATDLQRVDGEGISVSQAAKNFVPDLEAPTSRKAAEMLGYLEVHIEQGPVLERDNLPVAVVTAIAGQSRIRFEFTGQAGHAGTVPMSAREDALCGAAEFILSVEKLAKQTPGLVATVGQLAVAPGASNVIPGSAKGTLDVRHAEDTTRAHAVAELQAEFTSIAAARGLQTDWILVQEASATPCDPRLTTLLGNSIVACGYPAPSLPSGAGHDAAALASLCPVAMLFVRCRGGISHHPDEFASTEDIGVAYEVLLHAVRALQS